MRYLLGSVALGVHEPIAFSNNIQVQITSIVLNKQSIKELVIRNSFGLMN